MNTRLVGLTIAALIVIGAGVYYWHVSYEKAGPSAQEARQFDTNSGYYLEDASRQSGEGSLGKGGYFIEGGEVFFGNNGEGMVLEPWRVPVSGADPATFFVLTTGTEADVYAKDKTNVYIAGSVVPGADSSSFSLVPATAGSYAKDQHSVYVLSGASVRNSTLTVIPVADPATFTVPR